MCTVLFEMTVFEKITFSRSVSHSFSLPQTLLIGVLFSSILTSNCGELREVLKNWKSGDDEEHPVCGRVYTTLGETVNLRQGLALSEEEFHKIQKLENAKFIPVKVGQSGCAIQSCGFTSWGDIYNGSFIGSTSDYADCQVYLANTTAPAYIYNGAYNSSSIGCGCTKRTEDCTYTCADRAFKLQSEWGENDCAVMFQEPGCNSCYMQYINVTKGQNYSTDNSNQIRTMVVRDKCVVKQYIPNLHKVWRFRHLQQPVLYLEGPTETNIISTFLNESDVFHCECDIPPSPPHDNPSFSSKDAIYVGLIGGGIFMVLGVLTGFVILKKQPKRIRRTATNEKVLPESRNSTESIWTATTGVSPIEVSESEMEDLKHRGNSSHFISQFASSAFDTKPQNFEILRPLDSANFGEVCEGKLRVAIKRVKAGIGSNDEEFAKQSLQQELKILTHLGSNRNVVRLLGAHMDDSESGELILIIELCECSLKSYLTTTVNPRVMDKLRTLAAERIACLSNENGYPTIVAGNETQNSTLQSIDYNLNNLDSEMLKQFYQWIHDIACGMEYIQSKKIIHVDLAARNVLLTHSLTAKIADFGLSKKYYINHYVSSRKDSLPIRWVAPESLKDYRYCPKSDVWSFGITAWEIFTLGKDPYEDMDGIQVLAYIINGKRLERPQFCPEDVYSMLKKCWENDPQNRPSFSDLEIYFREKVNTMERMELPSESDVDELTDLEGSVV